MAETTIRNTGASIAAGESFIEPGKLARDLWIRRIGRIGLWFNPVFAYFFLWAPILLLVVFSFNDSRTVSAWRGFTLGWYTNILQGSLGVDNSFSTRVMLDSLRVSLIVGVIATIFSTIIGTMAALALQRTNFPGKRFLDAVLLLPVVIPEITQGISLLVYFSTVFDYINRFTGITLQRGYTTLIIAHIGFCFSYVTIVVRSRLSNMNPRLEEAARDLGANEWQTFWRITFPLLFPAILAGALLAFTLSLDDYVITFFTRGAGQNTLTVFVFGLIKTGVTPEINAISTIVLAVSTVLIGISLIFQGRDAVQNA